MDYSRRSSTDSTCSNNEEKHQRQVIKDSTKRFSQQSRDDMETNQHKKAILPKYAQMPSSVASVEVSVNFNENYDENDGCGDREYWDDESIAATRRSDKINNNTSNNDMKSFYDTAHQRSSSNDNSMDNDEEDKKLPAAAPNTTDIVSNNNNNTKGPKQSSSSIFESRPPSVSSILESKRPSYRERIQLKMLLLEEDNRKATETRGTGDDINRSTNSDTRNTSRQQQEDNNENRQQREVQERDQNSQEGTTADDDCVGNDTNGISFDSSSRTSSLCNSRRNSDDNSEESVQSRPGAYSQSGRALGARPSWSRHNSTITASNHHNSEENIVSINEHNSNSPLPVCAFLVQEVDEEAAVNTDERIPRRRRSSSSICSSVLHLVRAEPLAHDKKPYVIIMVLTLLFIIVLVIVLTIMYPNKYVASPTQTPTLSPTTHHHMSSPTTSQSPTQIQSSLPTASPTRSVSIAVAIQLDENAHETSWSLRCGNEMIVRVPFGTYKGDENIQVTDTEVVGFGDECELTIKDKAGDGINNGHFEVYVGFENLRFDEAHLLLNGTGNFTYETASRFKVIGPQTLSPSATPVPTVTSAPTFNVIPVTIVMQLSDHPIHFAWVLDCDHTPEVSSSFGSYFGWDYEYVSETVLVKDGAECQFTIKHSKGDGSGLQFYRIYIGDNDETIGENLVVEGSGNFGYERIHYFSAV